MTVAAPAMTQSKTSVPRPNVSVGIVLAAIQHRLLRDVLILGVARLPHILVWFQASSSTLYPSLILRLTGFVPGGLI